MLKRAPHSLVVFLTSSFALADAAPELEEVEVTGRRINLVGAAVSASQGVISQDEIAY